MVFRRLLVEELFSPLPRVGLFHRAPASAPPVSYLSLLLGPQVPHSVENSRGRQMHNTFLRTNPSELPITGELPVEASEVTNDVPEVLVNHMVGEGIHSTGNNFRAFSQSEGNSIPFEPVFRIGL